ncbi:hypothetical protein RJ55_02818 [Drechmeria coniospora]|nr:hypothetical protein RJ55_02818 [Drechmeria coniospora]
MLGLASADDGNDDARRAILASMRFHPPSRAPDEAGAAVHRIAAEAREGDMIPWTSADADADQTSVMHHASTHPRPPTTRHSRLQQGDRWRTGPFHADATLLRAADRHPSKVRVQLL